MADIIRLRKGLEIPLAGKATDKITCADFPAEVAITPDDFPGHAWKAIVKVGDKVRKGSTLLIDKATQSIALAAPASGEVVEIRRGERRKILAIVIKTDAEQTQEDFSSINATESLRELLQKSGLWAMMRQRPYDVVPAADSSARDIFITAFDTAPLSGPVIDASNLKDLETGIEALASLTTGKVYLGVAFGSGISSTHAKVIEFQGPHPAGNVGVQIANVKPVNKGEIVWALDARTVARIGKLISTGQLDTATTIALTGEEVADPRLVRTIIGASLMSIANGQMLSDGVNKRIISGNVLTGTQESLAEGFLRFPYRQITVIPEGDTADEFMGWASISPGKYSVKRSFLSFLRKGAEFSFDARLKGSRRAPIISGECEKVFPMNIYPEFLLKAIRAKDIDKMEQLGIYEVAPEDFALAEFVDTSKEPLQAEVRDGLDYLRKELG